MLASIGDLLGGGGPLNGPARTLGDYAATDDIQSIINHLMAVDPNRFGPPPAAKSAVESLPEVAVDFSHVGMLSDALSTRCSLVQSLSLVWCLRVLAMVCVQLQT